MGRPSTETGDSPRTLETSWTKVNAKKSFFGRGELEYLGYWITCKGVMPVPKKIEAIKNIATPKSIRDVRKFVGMVNYYRDMWIRRSDTLAPLTKLCSKSAKFIWKEEQEKAFNTIRRPYADIPFLHIWISQSPLTSTQMQVIHS